MSLFAVKNDEGKYWDDVAGTWTDSVSDAWELEDEAKEVAGQRGHVVELVEKPTPVVVSEAEAKLLKGVHGVYIYPAGESISRFVQAQYGHGSMSADQALEMEKHLMRAYVIGWVIEKPKRCVLPMPDGTAGETSADIHVAIHEGFGPWHSSQGRHDITDSKGIHAFTVTQANIDAAPDWVKAIKPVEIRDEREIKFRVWDKDSKLMDNVVRLEVDDGGHIDTAEGYGGVYHNFELMQFTGLKDKNGVEIYEGDLLRVELDDDPESYYIAPVTWCGGDYPAFDIVSKYWPKNVSYDTNVLSAIVAGWSEEVMSVIGNIYENPELMEVEDG